MVRLHGKARLRCRRSVEDECHIHARSPEHKVVVSDRLRQRGYYLLLFIRRSNVRADDVRSTSDSIFHVVKVCACR